MTRARNKSKKKSLSAEKHSVGDWGRMPKHSRKFYLLRKNSRNKSLLEN